MRSVDDRYFSAPRQFATIPPKKEIVGKQRQFAQSSRFDNGAYPETASALPVPPNARSPLRRPRLRPLGPVPDLLPRPRPCRRLPDRDAPLAASVGWLLFAGPLTAIPLLLFAAGARRITLATLGTLQYLSPTLQFLLGVTFFGEPLQGTRLVGFVVIWTALLVYSADGFLWMRRQRAEAVPT